MAGPVREVLLAERARAGRRVAVLEREFAQLAEAASAGGTDDEHDPEGATLAFERQHTAALLERAKEALAAIEAALERMRDGRYGRCDRCGQPIGDDRLAARPAALTCVPCAALRRLPVLLRRLLVLPRRPAALSCVTAPLCGAYGTGLVSPGGISR